MATPRVSAFRNRCASRRLPLDLMVLWQGRRIGFEFKFADAPGITKSMHVAMADLKLDRLLVVVPGKESYDLGPKMEVVSILHLVERLGRMAED